MGGRRRRLGAGNACLCLALFAAYPAGLGSPAERSDSATPLVRIRSRTTAYAVQRALREATVRLSRPGCERIFPTLETARAGRCATPLTRSDRQAPSS